MFCQCRSQLSACTRVIDPSDDIVSETACFVLTGHIYLLSHISRALPWAFMLWPFERVSRVSIAAMFPECETGDLQSEEWRGRETTPQRGNVRAETYGRKSGAVGRPRHNEGPGDHATTRTRISFWDTIASRRWSEECQGTPSARPPFIRRSVHGRSGSRIPLHRIRRPKHRCVARRCRLGRSSVGWHGIRG